MFYNLLPKVKDLIPQYDPRVFFVWFAHICSLSPSLDFKRYLYLTKWRNSSDACTQCGNFNIFTWNQFWHPRSSKNAIFALLETLNFHFLVNFSFCKLQKFLIINIQCVLKWQFLRLQFRQLWFHVKSY